MLLVRNRTDFSYCEPDIKTKTGLFFKVPHCILSSCGRVLMCCFFFSFSFCSCKFHLCTSYSVECQLTCACGFSSFLAFCCCSLCFEFQLCTSDSVECEFHSIDGYVTFSEGVPVFIFLIVNFRRRIIQKAQRVMPSTWPRS